MVTQGFTRPAWTLAGASLAMLIAGTPLVLINDDAVGSNLPVIVLFSSCAVIGALAVSRQPGNRVGWLFLAIGLVAALQVLTGELAILFYRNDGPSRVFQWLAWPGDWGWILAFGPLLTLLPLLFPDGRPPSRRWRPVLWLALSCIFYESVASAVAPGRFDKPPVRNPVGIGTGPGTLAPLADATVAISAGVCIVCVSSLFFRYRRADGDERQRVKWFASALPSP